MTSGPDMTASTLDRIRHDQVGLKMPRALEALGQIVRRLEHGEIGALEAIGILLSVELISVHHRFTYKDDSIDHFAGLLDRMAIN